MPLNPNQYAAPSLGVGGIAWSNFSGFGPGVSIAANGSSGQVSLAPFARLTLLVAIITAPTGTSPTLTLTINGMDTAGNLFPLGSTSALNATGNTLLEVGPGLGTNNHIIPALGSVSWVIGGSASPTFSNVELSLIGR